MAAGAVSSSVAVGEVLGGTWPLAMAASLVAEAAPPVTTLWPGAPSG